MRGTLESGNRVATLPILLQQLLDTVLQTCPRCFTGGLMRLTASDIISLHRPTPCDLRVYLREQEVPEAEPSIFEQILQTLGQRHEEEHLATLGAYEDLSLFRPDERIQ